MALQMDSSSCSCPPDLIVEKIHVSEEILGVSRPTRTTYASETTGGLRCAVKKFGDLHRTDRSDSFSTFIAGCKTWSEMRHPNIQQLMGVCFDKDGIPAVVTELLPFNLVGFLNLNLSEPMKYCVLLDVARGLQYLHTRNPPVAHRNVTPNNILLTSGLQARLSDPALSDPAVSDCGGAVPSAICGIQADIIAFGRIVHQVVCSHALQACTSDSMNDKELKGHDSGSLHNLSLKCLCDDESERPSINVVVEEIKMAVNANPLLSKHAVAIGEEFSFTKEGSTEPESQMAALNKTIKAHEETLREQQQNRVLLEQEIEGKTTTIEAQKEQIECYKQLLHAKDTELQAQQQILNSKQGQLKVKEREVLCITQDASSKESLLALANTRIRALEHQLQALKNKVSQPPSPLLPADNAATMQPTSQYPDGDGVSDETQPNAAQNGNGQVLSSAEQTSTSSGGPDLLKRRVGGRSRFERLATLSDGITLSDWMMVKGAQRDKETTPQEDTEPKLTSLLARQLKKIDENAPDEHVHKPEGGGADKKDLVTTAEPTQPVVLMRRKKTVNQEADPQLQKLLTKRRSMAEIESANA